MELIVIARLTLGSYIYEKSITQDIDLFVYVKESLIISSLTLNNLYWVDNFVTILNHDLHIVIKRFFESRVGDVALGYNF